MPFPVYHGNRPTNIRKDAKYHIRSHNGSYVVAIMYGDAEHECWYLCTEKHPLLVKMVNEARKACGKECGGTFYINEYHQVVVPAAVGTGDYYLAGEYREHLRFDFEGNTISGEPIDMLGHPLSIGSEWMGPHAGIPYILAANGMDIYYKSSSIPDLKIMLSGTIDHQMAATMARKINAIKKQSGGRFYVNECGAIFTPVEFGDHYKYLFAGCLNLDMWFNKPNSELPGNWFG